MFFLITNVILDIGLGTSYWILKQTSYGMYSLYLYLISNNQKLIKYDNNLEEKKSIERLEDLCKQQGKKIEELNSNLENLSELLKNKLE